jgi:hypothetical protein
MLKLSAMAIAIGTVALVVASTNVAFAEDQWQKDHPRRAEVNDRLHRQDRRIHREVKEGEMSKSQAAQLHKDDHSMRREERSMASQHGGHISRQEQAALNHQENGVSREIGR